ncbi:MAG: radical SAM protein [Desulfatitalea sp.]|nr:radical SAM protein [Desulfatitalea sp.]NNK02594.1 radical SAM protein [Desulfatitalea sp.]
MIRYSKQSPIVSALQYINKFGRNRIPGQVVIQTTNYCNARCPQCGMRKSANIPRTSLSDETMILILDACAERGVQAVSFTGGEPLLKPDSLIKWIDHAGKVGIPFIRTGTNGFIFCNSDRPGFTERIKLLAERLASTPLRNFWISLDSHIPEVHEQMRGLPGVVRGIEKALPIFHAAGLYPSANLGINRLVGGRKTQDSLPQHVLGRQSYLNLFYSRFAEALDQFFRFVNNLGFTIVNTCYPMSIGEEEKKTGLTAVYSATATEDVVRFTEDEKALLFKALLNIVPRHRDRLRIFSPLSSIYMLYRTYMEGQEAAQAFGCRGGVDFFFIDAIGGDTYPCGYRGGENLGKFWNLDLNQRRPEQDCHLCDWECFRDPSEMCSPFLQGLHEPGKIIRKMTGDPIYRRLWLSDLKYYRFCDFFDGRRPADVKELHRFSLPSSSELCRIYKEISLKLA